MKKLALLTAIVAIVGITSCGEDSNAPSNTLKLDGLSLTATNGYYQDIGEICDSPAREDGCVNAFQRYMVNITDGEIGSDDSWPENYTFSVNGSLYSLSTGEASALDEGEYTIGGNSGLHGDFDVDFEDGEVAGNYYNLEGTLTVSGTLPSVKLTFDLTADFYADQIAARSDVLLTDPTVSDVPLKGTISIMLQERTLQVCC